MKQSNTIFTALGFGLLLLFSIVSYLFSKPVYRYLIEWEASLEYTTTRFHVFIFLFSISFMFTAAVIFILIVLTPPPGKRN